MLRGMAGRSSLMPGGRIGRRTTAGPPAGAGHHGAILAGTADESLMLERLERPLPASWRDSVA
jgi:hypothetical protein